jgi:hypothetical protein
MDATKTATHINELWSKKIKPGFASLEANQNTVDAYLTTLFSGAPTQQMPVYFYATAGMRLLPQIKQKTYYQAVQNWFNQQSQWQLIEAKTITGMDEALYDWLAVNYHLDKLKNPTPIGVMDIGGASVQVVFPVQKNYDSTNNSQVELTLYGHPITLSVHSFIGLGQNEMTHQLLDNPSCFSNGYPLPNGELGQGDSAQCKQEVSPLINEVHKVNKEIQSSLSNNHISAWYVIGGLANLAESKPFSFPSNQVTNQELLHQANNLICHQSWDNLNNQFPNNEYIESYCLLPAFYYALIVDGYGLSPTQPLNFIPTTQNLDWTTGVVLHH